MEIKKISHAVMKKFLEANGSECSLSEQKTTVYSIGSSALPESRTVATGGIPIQVAGGLRKAKRQGSAIKQTCWWIIKDPPGEKGYFAIGPISKKILPIMEISKEIS